MKVVPLFYLATGAAALRNIVYFDQWHTDVLPSKNVTAGITHVIMAFAGSSLFTTSPAGEYSPFMPLDQVRSMFDNGTKVGIAIGGWGDTAGFSQGAKDDASRKLYAQNVAAMIEEHGFDLVDVDWEYPAGNGADYKQIPNSEKTSEIETYPLLLAEIKAAIGSKELSIAVPGLARDMLAFTPEQSPKIWDAVDFVNVMTYDLMNRRDNLTTHHTSVKGSLEAIDRYQSLGLTPCKMNLGFAYYAKFFQTAPGADCSNLPVGCPIVQAEKADGSDAGTSGAMTFEAANVVPPPAPPANLTMSPDSSCGPGTTYTCGSDNCCSQYGFCGDTDAHCGTGCHEGYGKCAGAVSTTSSFQKALAAGQTDDAYGGQWYWDADAELFWTWDTPQLIERKFREIVSAKQLGGVMAWSLAEDSFDWSHLTAISNGVRRLSPAKRHIRRSMGHHA